MKKIVLLSFCLIMTAVTVFAADVSQNIDNKFSFRFPAQPEIKEVMGMKNFVYTTDSSSYLVQVKAFDKKTVVHDTATLSAFYTGTVKGILRGAKGSLIASKHIAVGDLLAEEVEYTKPGVNGPAVSIITRILLVNDEVLVYSFITPLELMSNLKTDRDRFFNSFAINKNLSVYQIHPTGDAKAIVSTTDTTRTATPIFDSVTTSHQPVTVHTELVKSNTLHFIISFAVSILLLAGILYVLVRWKKKNDAGKA